MSSLLERVLYHDRHVLVLNKPAGIPVHKGYGGGEYLEAQFGDLAFDLPRAPALAHRLDRDTAGCLVLGRHRQALARLNQLFRNQRVEKVYWAVAYSTLPWPEGELSQPLSQQREGSGWRVRADAAGQEAVTQFKLLGTANGMSWLECRPLTGRTHQIRVHAAHLGCPLVGDHLYGGAVRGRDALLHLHARAVSIPYAASAAPIMVEAPPPPHMLKALNACGWR